VHTLRTQLSVPGLESVYIRVNPCRHLECVTVFEYSVSKCENSGTWQEVKVWAEDAGSPSSRCSW